MANILTAPSKAGTSQQMADSLPQGRAWGKKNTDDSNTRKLINSLAVAHNSTQQSVELLDQEFRIDQTTNLIEEWEKSVGLPSECKTSVGTIEQRRSDVIERIKRDPLVTLAQIQGYVDNALPDLDVILYPGGLYTGFPERLTYTTDGAPVTNSYMTYYFPVADFIGKTVEVGVWIKNVDIVTPLHISARDEPISVTYGTTGLIPITTDWVYYTFNITVPDPAPQPNARIDIDLDDAADGLSIYVDDMNLGGMVIQPTDANWVQSQSILTESTTFPPTVNRKFLLVAEVQSESESFVYTDSTGFPFSFTGGVNIEEFTCIMNKILPSNVLLLTYYI